MEVAVEVIEDQLKGHDLFELAFLYFVRSVCL